MKSFLVVLMAIVPWHSFAQEYQIKDQKVLINNRPYFEFEQTKTGDYVIYPPEGEAVIYAKKDGNQKCKLTFLAHNQQTVFDYEGKLINAIAFEIIEHELLVNDEISTQKLNSYLNQNKHNEDEIITISGSINEIMKEVEELVGVETSDYEIVKRDQSKEIVLYGQNIRQDDIIIVYFKEKQIRNEGTQQLKVNIYTPRHQRIGSAQYSMIKGDYCKLVTFKDQKTHDIEIENSFKLVETIVTFLVMNNYL